MPFVNRQNSPERITHLTDQYRTAKAEWDQVRTVDEEETEEEIEARHRLADISLQLQDKPTKHQS